MKERFELTSDIITKVEHKTGRKFNNVRAILIIKYEEKTYISVYMKKINKKELTIRMEEFIYNKDFMESRSVIFRPTKKDFYGYTDLKRKFIEEMSSTKEYLLQYHEDINFQKGV